MNNTPHTNCLTLRLLHAAKGYKAVAFDIFDTLLKRDCAHPADLFALMEVTHQAALGFAGARAAAEAETRQTLGREVTLAEIYAHPALRGTDPAAECAAELAMIAPNRPVAQAAAACHARGQKVYAVSDMYLPKEQIEAMLQKCGLDFLDGVFVSCEYGVQNAALGLRFWQQFCKVAIATPPTASAGFLVYGSGVGCGSKKQRIPASAAPTKSARGLSPTNKTSAGRKAVCCKKA